MHNPRLGLGTPDSQFEYIELDPSGRYGRFKEILGKGAMKTVYRAFDEMDGTEVAWNQVKLNNVFRSPEDLNRLFSEVHLLHNLDHPSIMRFHSYWVDLHRTTFNFITEMFTSGTLRLYRNKYKRASMRAVKNWARQILQGLAHLHSHDPPIIHRDLKCDNIFVNGHLGQVKIGDLGLATILRCSQHAHSVIGTPEFMAPELYEEDYDELVDIYSFGMCMLEMLTAEYPYSECSNPAQIYKKVTSGKLPGAFYRIEDVEAQRFIRKCLETASERPSAHQLLMDPFLASEEADEQFPVTHSKPVPDVEAMLHVPSLGDPERCTDMTITGTLNPEDDTIFLKVQIAPKDNGQARNVYFPFDIYSDTVLDVAGEMVKELEISDWKPIEIAEMIDAEISVLVPSWSWKGCGHDDNTLVPPFCSLSSQYSNSSQASLPVLFTSCEEATTYHPSSNRMTSADPPEWIQVQEDYSNNEDATSQSSFNSYNLSYFSDHCENDTNSNTKIRELRAEVMVGKSIKGSRFSPQVSGTKKGNALRKTESGCSLNENGNIKLARVRSLVDLRSQLLHRSLVEEINKRRMFKTVGAVENIGYLEPASEIGSGGRCAGKLPNQGFEW